MSVARSVPVARGGDRPRVDAAAREALILKHLPLVRAVVRKVMANLPRSILREDLEAYGVVGLMEALERYNPDQGIQFETFAWPRIRGAILDHLRALDPATRADRTLAKRIQREFERLSGHHGRAATDEEVAASLQMDVDALRAEMGRLQEIIVYSFEDLVRDHNGDRPVAAEPYADEGDGPADTLERSELLESLRRGLGQLPDREKMVLGLYYYERLTLAEIAAILDLTESRVCQIQSAALLRLRGMMGREGFAARG
jgi:RNA polymerase sigma factor for flagellar operon FliA